MPEFDADFFSELKFARKYFDFVEFTIELEPRRYTVDYIKRTVSLARGFELIGHLHWDIDLNDASSFGKIASALRVCAKFGIRKVIVHPSPSPGLDGKIIEKNNISALKKILKLADNYDLSLLVENLASEPFNTARGIRRLLGVSPRIGLVLDMGHINRALLGEFNNFLRLSRRIRHIHLHDTRGGYDHLFFSDLNKLKEQVSKIKGAPYDGTVTLEIFQKIQNNKYVKLGSRERKKILLSHLKVLRSL